MVSRHVTLMSVNLLKATVDTTLDPLHIPDELEFSQAYRAGYELHDADNDVIVVDAEFKFDGMGSDGPVVMLAATFRLTYTLEGAETFPADAMDHFAELNGIYNAWPYWRELVQTVTGRVGVASVTLPVFRPPVRVLEEEPEEDEPEAATA